MLAIKMKKLFFVTLFSISFLLHGCQSSDKTSHVNQDTLFQYSVLSTLLQGVYDGNMTCAELKEYGDFGLGTFNTLDGEMIVYDSKVYQVASDGIARVVNDDKKTPFAAVTFFKSDKTVSTSESMDCTELKLYIDAQLPTKNIAYAIKVDGLFSHVKTRSVPSQSKPYPLLSEVVKTQPTFEFSEQNGTLIGFRLPSYMEYANAVGYHFHFLTKNRDAGGHLLECRVEDVSIEIDYTDEWKTLLPSDSEFYNAEIAKETYE